MTELTSEQVEEELSKYILHERMFLTDGQDVELELHHWPDGRPYHRFKEKPLILKGDLNDCWMNLYRKKITLFQLKQHYRNKGVRVGFLFEAFGSHLDGKMENYASENGNLQDLTDMFWILMSNDCGGETLIWFNEASFVFDHVFHLKVDEFVIIRNEQWTGIFHQDNEIGMAQYEKLFKQFWS